MRKKTLTPTRPSLDTLACVNAECKDYARPGLNNLTVRKVYGEDKIRYLRCRTCQREFSERKRSALWNTKVSEARAESVAEHLAEGCSVSATQRLAKVDRSVVVRLNRCLGQHGQGYHDERVQQVESAIERRNGTARRMVAYQVRRSSAFAHRPETKKAQGSVWALTV